MIDTEFHETTEAALRGMTARILGDLRQIPMTEALRLLDAVGGDCYTETVAALGFDPLEANA